MDFALGIFVTLSFAYAGEPHRDGSHVRTADARMRAAIVEGIARSALFAGLVARLDASDVIVYVVSDCLMPEPLRGRLTFMSAAGGRRYLKVRIACMLAENVQVAMLGHELQHAVEVANAESVVDEQSLGAEYRRIGFASRVLRPGCGYDSHAAIDAGHQVWRELSRAE